MASLSQGLGLFHRKNNLEEELKKNIIEKRKELDKNIKDLLKEFKKTDEKRDLELLDKKEIEKLLKITRKTHIKITEYRKLLEKLQHINNLKEYDTTIISLETDIDSLDWMLKKVIDKKEEWMRFIDQETAKTIRYKLKEIEELWIKHLNEYRDKKH